MSARLLCLGPRLLPVNRLNVAWTCGRGHGYIMGGASYGASLMGCPLVSTCATTYVCLSPNPFAEMNAAAYVCLLTC